MTGYKNRLEKCSRLMQAADLDVLLHTTSPTQAEANQRVKPLLDGRPSPEFYSVVLD